MLFYGNCFDNERFLFGFCGIAQGKQEYRRAHTGKHKTDDKKLVKNIGRAGEFIRNIIRNRIAEMNQPERLFFERAEIETVFHDIFEHHAQILTDCRNNDGYNRDGNICGKRDFFGEHTVTDISKKRNKKTAAQKI